MNWKNGRIVIRRVPYDVCKDEGAKACEINMTHEETGEEICITLQEIRGKNSARIGIATKSRSWRVRRADSQPRTEDVTDGH